MTVSPGAPVGQRISNVMIAGAPLDPARSYTVAATDYQIEGGDGYAIFASQRVLVSPETGPLIVNALEKYVAARGTISPVKEGRIRIAGTEIAGPVGVTPAAAGEGLTLGLRPEHLAPSVEGPDTIRARLDFSEYLGGTRYLYCQMEDGQNLIAEYRDGPDVEPGDVLHLACPAERRRFFSRDGLRLR